MTWQGNPDLVKHRRRLVASTLARQYLELTDSGDRQYRQSLTTDTEIIRADGGVICRLCALTYSKHPWYPYEISEGLPFVKELCDGAIVKL